MVELAALTAMLFVAALAWGIYRLMYHRPASVRTRRIMTGWRREQRWSESLVKLFGVDHADEVSRHAGRPGGLTGLALLQWQHAFGLMVFVVFLKVSLPFALAVGVFAWYAPRFLLGVLAQQRRTQIALELPAFLDLWGLLVASGEGVETALVEICKRHPDWLLTTEIERVRHRVSASGLFGESLIEEAKVTGSPEFVAVAEQVSHLADGGGVPSKELARMAEQMREQRVTELMESVGAMAIVGIFPKLGAVFLSLAPVIVTIALSVARQV